MHRVGRCPRAAVDRHGVQQQPKAARVPSIPRRRTPARHPVLSASGLLVLLGLDRSTCMRAMYIHTPTLSLAHVTRYSNAHCKGRTRTTIFLATKNGEENSSPPCLDTTLPRQRSHPQQTRMGGRTHKHLSTPLAGFMTPVSASRSKPTAGRKRREGVGEGVINGMGLGLVQYPDDRVFPQN